MYYLLLALFYLLSLIPLPLLYLLSDLLYLLIYYIIGYRKKVVFDNLEQAFPEKTTEERKKIAKKYYQNLTDMMVECLKMLTISKRSLNKRFSSDLSILQEMMRQGRSCQVHLGHHFNWEWGNLFFKLYFPQPFLIVYMPVHNKIMDRLINKMRSRFGSVMIPANDIMRAMQPWQQKQYISVLVADQNPGKRRRCYWAPFMNKMTAFYKGPELTARRNDIAVLFGEIRRVKRGHYQAILKLAAEHPAEKPEQQLTKEFALFLEENIKARPDNWLWSHRRWKHQYHPEEQK